MTAPSHPKRAGRFAPSPSGPLHFGSLLAAVASYLDARASGSRWLVRIEDIDPPREVPGADRLILATLEAHALHWDGEVLYQSTRHDRYREVLAQLAARGLTYRCQCARARLATLGHRYDGHCLAHPPPPGVPCAIRLRLPDRVVCFDDRIQGPQQQSLSDAGDCIILRKDGLFAYQLAVVVDDVDQGITDVVRGADILEATARQIFLIELLGGRVPQYAHTPLALGPDGQKLSKQNHAPALDLARPSHNLCEALRQLGQHVPPDLVAAPPAAVLDWAIPHWQPGAIPRNLPVTT